MNIKCEVCIPTRGRTAQLNDLLASLVAVDKSRISGVMIGITGPAEESTDYVTDYMTESLRIQGVPVTVFDGCSGLMDAKTQFKERSAADILLIVDDDVVLTHDYFDLLDHFKDPKVGAVAGTYQSSINEHYKDWSKDPVDNPDRVFVNRLVYRDGLVDLDDKYQVVMLKKPAVYKCEALVGSAVFARRELLQFDMKFDYAVFLEEFDYTYRIFSEGYDLLFDSSRMVFHNRGRAGGNRNRYGLERKKDNARYFMEKWFPAKRRLVVAVDFDGTIVKKVPFQLGDADLELQHGAVETLQDMKKLGAVLVLYSTRTGQSLENALAFCKNHGIDIDFVNRCPIRQWTEKLDADIYIDDRATPDGVVDWEGFLKLAKEKAQA